MLLRPAVVVSLCTTLLGGCSGAECDDLPRLLAERDATRAAYQELTASTSATQEQTTAADEELHALDARVFDLQQSCGR